ncbi:hypothetical protein ASPWEDRAFT_42695 [Aspergillus wentii DTO 134E9]|uniref:Uncharacterized protein n=1 Tax=Aspergillus wentii DTO 134E9 TaxID=1073089 RepID=A0A1L9RCP2_ASPWE|nr:uncharacterized protein ASPWEDRAFT_42695 [Aspergillus wentii DTO 134E9]OJJ32684.1 hypothetical protein ASPWEDRAFT_42695 [Aspergillus wentii DTO 134E9]
MRQYIDQLDREKLASIVHQATQAHPDVALMVTAAIREIREKERRRIINFDFYSKAIWRKINIKYSSMTGSKQYDIAGEVVGEIASAIDTIVASCGSNANSQTRYNGLSVLRKIGKTIALSATDTLGHEVQQEFQGESCLEDGMWEIVSAMTIQERDDIVNDNQDEEALWPKLEELLGLANDYCIFERLGDVLDLLSGEGDYDEEKEENEGDGENEEQYEDFSYAKEGDETEHEGGNPEFLSCWDIHAPPQSSP